MSPPKEHTEEPHELPKAHTDEPRRHIEKFKICMFLIRKQTEGDAGTGA